MKRASPFTKTARQALILLAFSLLSYPTYADHKSNHKPGGGPGGDGGGGLGGGGSKKISVEKTLLSENGALSGIAETGEALTYQIRLSNAGKKAVTVLLTETVPFGTTHGAITDDFSGQCNSGAAAESCQISVLVAGKDSPPTDVSFSVAVDAEITLTELTNTISVDGIDCASAPNVCEVVTPTAEIAARARHLINRLSFGITPAQLDDINQGVFDAEAYKTAQLFPAVGDCTEPDQAHGAAMDPNSPYGKNLPIGISPVSSSGGQSLAQLQTYTLLMASYNVCQLREVLANFWSNHFSTQWNTVKNKYKTHSGETDDNVAGRQATAWELQESDGFRVNALGNFRNLVEISAKSPANLYYLDGVISVAGNPNENYPRELMELNTLSVDGGYTQTDVEQVAIALTGWTVDPLSFSYTCDPATHDYISAITLDLGQTPVTLAARDPLDRSQANCEAAGQFVLDQLFNHSSTAEYLCEKLSHLFLSEITDSPSYANAVECL